MLVKQFAEERDRPLWEQSLLCYREHCEDTTSMILTFQIE